MLAIYNILVHNVILEPCKHSRSEYVWQYFFFENWVINSQFLDTVHWLFISKIAISQENVEIESMQKSLKICPKIPKLEKHTKNYANICKKNFVQI